MRMLSYALAALLAMPALPAPAQEQGGDPLLDLLNNRAYNRKELMSQFQSLRQTIIVAPTPTVTLTSPDAPDAPDAPAADNAAAGGVRFRPIAPLPPTYAAPSAPTTSLALILPLNALGQTATIATQFQQGCIRELEAAGSLIRVDTYAHDGSGEQALAAYNSAADDGAPLIIGPLRRNNVRQVALAHPNAPARTIVLQPMAEGNRMTTGRSYYVMTLDVGQEAMIIAALINAQTDRAMVIYNDSDISTRQRERFTAIWRGLRGDSPDYFYARSEADWQRLFNTLKDELEAISEKQAEDPNYEPPQPKVVFVAGDGDFIRAARSFTPQRYDMYAGSVFFSGGNDTRFIDNLHLLEMPWFVERESDAVSAVESARVRARPALHQRFYALGADACRAARQSTEWYEGWQMAGASGNFRLSDSVFLRQGAPARYSAGALKKLTGKRLSQAFGGATLPAPVFPGAPPATVNIGVDAPAAGE